MHRHDEMLITHTAAAHEDNDESLQPTSDTDNPHQTNEQNYSEDVLNAWKVDAEDRSKLPRLSHQQHVMHNHVINEQKFNTYYSGEGLYDSCTYLLTYSISGEHSFVLLCLMPWLLEMDHR